MERKTLFKNVNYLDPVSFKLTTGCIIIEKNKIYNTVDNFDKSIDVDDIYPADNYIVFPGLVNAHIHPSKILYQGMFDKNNLFETLNSVHTNNKKEKRNLQYEASLYTLLSSLSCGVTTFGIFTSRPIEDIKAVIKSNVRANICYSQNNIWNGCGVPPTISCLKNIKTNYYNIKDSFESNKILISPATASELTSSIELINLYQRISKEQNRRFFMHLHEGEQTVMTYKKKNGISPIKNFFKNKILSREATFIHLTCLTETEKDIIANSKASLIHCPSSNLFVKSGRMDIDFFCREKNHNIGLGTDAAMINPVDSLSFEALLTYNNNEITAKKTLQMITIDGAKSLGFNNIGLIQKGYIADLIFFDKRELSYPYVNTPMSLLTLLYREKPAKIIIDGEFVYDINEKTNKFEDKNILYSLCKERKFSFI
ncbi:hypothetical protein DOH76_23570 [Salmonella enterica subsp. enterica serovar Oranienburg]|uniref:Amidohydrolase-related domain-containing protein n=1 Tax=Salmonella diarizonae TaxID=59204 RepID=A0A5Y1YCR5_SALDZ|nr:hypothetical protein [Salmonella enterica subsp. enterica serovar Oranienburg]ECC3916753.1 hypothetical protein [Salmonella enterica subsp. diarizonae]EDR7001695.1 amidohydrolase family protein [Salmonella enterica subsp. enterica serovar Java]EEH0186441.1 amidohydrolase family protein [Salmonella enterica subsp. enterica serovar Oranienburg]EJC3483635.1 amidohydrolase family protein [Salmonella enterica]